jgi:N-methylhydantoinase B
MMLEAVSTQVIRSYLCSAAEEMRRTLIRTAFNPVIYEVLDFGISIYDRNLELIADAPGLALFLGANDYAIRKGVEYIGRDNFERGDIVLMNYPYWNSAHAMDVTLFAPVFALGAAEPFAFTCIRAHWMDLGAKDPGYVLDSTDIQQEGLILPGLKVYKRGRPDREIFELIRFNSRMPELVIGDLEAQVAATRTGERRLIEIHEKFGSACLDEAIQQILTHGEALVRQGLAKLPHGTWSAQDLVDDDGVSDAPVPIRVTVTLNESGMHCDFTGSSPAVRGPINMPFGLTETVCKLVLKSLTTPGEPSNAGHFRPLTVVAQPGTLFHAVHPAPTFTLWTAHLAIELVYKALAQGMGDRLAASSGGDVPGFMMVGNDPEGNLYAVSNNDAVGWGASAAHDGVNATNHISGSLVRNTPVEVMEMRTGLFIEALELRCDSGGAGRHRGGLGETRRIRFRSSGEFLTVTKKTKTRPWALAGGLEPQAISMCLFPGQPNEKRVGTYRARVSIGDRAVYTTAGGGGYGSPVERNPDSVLEDVLEGYVSPTAARDTYRVVIRDGHVDQQATAQLRAELKPRPNAIPRIHLAPGYEISRIIKGGWQLAGGHGPVDSDESPNDMAAFVEAGITAFDCADIYTGVEAMIGAFRSRYPELARRTRIHTKFVPDLNSLSQVDAGYVEKSIDRSLVRLGTGQLDLVQFHWWDYAVRGYVEAALELARLRAKGKICHVGVTNFDVPRLTELLANGVPVTAHQLQYSLLDTRPENGMTELCRAHGISLLCYGTVAGGFLSNRWLGVPEPGHTLSNRSLIKYRLIIEDFGGWGLFQRLLEALHAIAVKHGCDIATVASHAVLERAGVAAVIVGATNVSHLSANARIGSLDLDAEDHAAIEAVMRLRKGPQGDVFTLERDRNGRHGRIMKYDLHDSAHPRGG